MKHKRSTSLCLALLAASLGYGEPEPASYAQLMSDGLTDDNVKLNYHAIVIGVNDYKHRPPMGWDDLNTAKNDATVVADVLEKKYKFDVQRLCDRDATRVNIVNKLDSLSQYDQDDAVLIYYAGHGFFDKELGEGFWIPYDARKKSGATYLKYDWIWNSTITKMIGASRARHILVVSDSCYSGSLFRGPAAEESGELTVDSCIESLLQPSRYLITSGDYEPVPDAGARHSAFAQSFINQLQYPDHDLMAAAAIGLKLKQKVSQLTGQNVRCGPMALASHQNGSMVFVSNPTVLDTWKPTRTMEVAQVAPAKPTQPKQDTQKLSKRQKTEALRDVALLDQQGAGNTARMIIKQLGLEKESADDMIARAVLDHINVEKRAQRHSRLSALLEKLENRKRQLVGVRNAFMPLPRVVACIGPSSSRGGARNESQALLYHILIKSALLQNGKMVVVERDFLENVLTELDLGTSELADHRAKLEIGKLLPAGVQVVGQMIPMNNKDMLAISIFDSETSRNFQSITKEVTADMDLGKVCNEVAEQILKTIASEKPLGAKVEKVEEDYIQVKLGFFHGATKGMHFVINHLIVNPENKYDRKLNPVGKAKIVELREDDSILKATWDKKFEGGELWVKEVYLD